MTNLPFGASGEARPVQKNGGITPGDSVSSFGSNRLEELEQAFMVLEAEKTRLESRSRANEAFFSGMADEIQVPLAAAVALTDQLLQESSDSRVQDLGGDIRSTIQAALLIVNDVLDLAKLSAGQLSLDEATYNIRTLVRNIRSIAFFQAKEKGLRLDFRLDSAIPEYLHGDGKRVRQVLQIFVENALHHTDRGHIAVTISKDRDRIRIDVADTGRGLDADQVDALFSPFHNPSGNVRGSNGLGLAIGKSLVEMMGGSVIVDSEPGAGSRFHLQLPLRLPAPDETPMESPDSTGGYHILIVDDNENNLKHASRALESMGYQTATASSGQQALQMILEDDYDLILMDCSMPEMDGAATTRAIRCMGKGDLDLPILGLSLTAKPEYLQDYIASGMTDVLSKPVREAQLREALKKWLGPRNERGKGATTIFSSSLSLGRPGSYGIVERAVNIEGLDTSLGLENVGGQYAMYEELLNLAGESLPGLVDSLMRTASVDGDGDGDGQILIDLNGLEESLYTLGAAGLSTEARECEKVIRTNGLESCRERLNTFIRSLRILTNQIQALFNIGGGSSSAIYGDRFALEKRLHKILHEMQLGHHDEVQNMAQAVARRDYEGVPKVDLLEVKHLVHARDYRGATARIHVILAKLAR